MHFTFYLLEPAKTTGAELCCDWCNKKCHLSLGDRWYYQRYNEEDEWPSNFVCYDCRVAMELNS